MTRERHEGILKFRERFEEVILKYTGHNVSWGQLQESPNFPIITDTVRKLTSLEVPLTKAVQDLSRLAEQIEAAVFAQPGHKIVDLDAEESNVIRRLNEYMVARRIYIDTLSMAIAPIVGKIEDE